MTAPAEETGWTDEGRAWLAERPSSIREKAEAYPPWQTYRLKPTGQLARINSYSENEDGSCDHCCVVVWPEGLPVAHGVFGIPFTELEPVVGDDEG